MEKTKNPLWIKLTTLITFLAMITVNALANILPIAGIGTGAVSDSYPNLFAPAPITFAIWGLIYLLLALYTLYQFGVFNKDQDLSNVSMVVKISILFAISSVVNTAWIFSWHYKLIGLSLILMTAILVLLILINLEIKKRDISKKEELFIKVPFSIYFGWITVASIANVVTFLVSVGWNGFGLSEAVWAVIIIAVGAVVGLIAILTYRAFFYGLVLIWAYAGIIIKHLSSSGFNGEYTAVIVTTAISIALFIAAQVMLLVKKK